MAKLSVLAGSTGQTTDLFIQDSTSTTGGGLTGLTYASSGLTAYYNFPRAASTAITLATLASPTATWSSGGFKEIDATNQPGKYRFDIPNAVIAASSGRSVSMIFRGAANMVPCPLEIELTGVDNQSADLGLGNATVPASPTLGTWGSAIYYADSKVGRRSTAQGGTATTITLDSGASAVDNAYKDHAVKIIAGTGAGQFATIVGYVGATKVATIFRPSGNWSTTPDSTSVFQIELVPVVDLMAVQTANITGNLAGNVTGSVGSVTGAVTLPTIAPSGYGGSGVTIVNWTVLSSPAPATSGGVTTFSATGGTADAADYFVKPMSVFWQGAGNDGTFTLSSVPARTTPGGVPTYAFAIPATSRLPVSGEKFILV